MKRASILFVLLLVVVAGVFALDANVTWSWSQNDPDVKFFRYQLDGEDEGSWIVVYADVLTASFDIDVSVEHTLYLQQSYDGANWSASSHTVSAAIEEDAVSTEEAAVVEPAADVTVEESSQPVDEQPSEEGEEASVEVVDDAKQPEDSDSDAAMPAAEVPAVVEPAAKASKVYTSPKSRIDLGVVYGNAIPFDTEKHSVGASLGYTFLFGKSGSFGFGAKAQVSAYTDFNELKDIKNATIWGSADLMLVADYSASWGDIYLGVGGELVAPVTALKSYKVGVVAQLGTRIRLGNVFGFGIEATGSYYLYPETARNNNLNSIGAKAYLSVEF